MKKVKRFGYSVLFIMLVFILGSTLDAKGQTLKKTFKYATFYTAFVNSVADDIYSVTNGLQTDVVETLLIIL